MSEESPPASSDMRFMVVAVALMVVVTALLAGLWLSMRARAIRAESKLARLRPQLDRHRDMTALFERALKDGSVTIPVVDRSDELARLRAELRRSREITALFERALKDGSLTIPVVDRSKLPAVTVKLDGREVKALRLGARLGESIGFAAGDVIIVQPPAPATSPAPAGGG